MCTSFINTPLCHIYICVYMHTRITRGCNSYYRSGDAILSRPCITSVNSLTDSFRGTEPHKFHTCIHRTWFVVAKIKCVSSILVFFYFYCSKYLAAEPLGFDQTRVKNHWLNVTPIETLEHHTPLWYRAV